MKKFKTKNKRRHRDSYLIVILVLSLIILHYYNTSISDKLINIAVSKLEQITTLYIKKDIAPKNIELNNLIKINLNSKEEITYIDIDTDYAREIMVETVGKIQNNIFELEKGNVEKYYNLKELKKHEGNIYLDLPIMISSNGVLTQSLGPKVPIKLSFYEHVFGNIDTEIIEYGINNAMIKIYLTISLEQKIIIPYKEQKYYRDYSILIGSKIIPGKVPSIYGDSINKSSSILEI